MSEWSFLTNHAQALLCIAHDPGARLIDIAASLGITERSAYAIVNDLTNAGYVVKEKDGRRNRYDVQGHLPLPGPVVRSATVGEVIAVLIGDSGAVAPVARRRPPTMARGDLGEGGGPPTKEDRRSPHPAGQPRKRRSGQGRDSSPSTGRKPG